LSGGADSSTCALLVAEMVRRSLGELGLKKVLKKLHIEDFIEDCQPHSIGLQRKMIVQRLLHCAYQGTKNSSDKTLSSARKLASEIGAEFSEWKIDEEVASYSQKIEKALNRTLSWETDDIAMQNIQARARSPIIWMLANIRQSLLIVTSNRSECDVGYSTMDGDTSGSIAPIAALDKHFILQWLKWAENTLDYQSLQLINSLTPSAELRPLENSQTDEDDLMPYAIIVEIEKLAIRERQSPTRIFEVLSATNLADEASLKLYIKKFFTLWSRNQWKRERTAPSFHLDDFNVDPRTWCRFPILSSAYFDELAELDHR
jgi:NAD+ synthase (glutamine-hydrolysing)